MGPEPESVCLCHKRWAGSIPDTRDWLILGYLRLLQLGLCLLGALMSLALSARGVSAPLPGCEKSTSPFKIRYFQGGAGKAWG
jgi:hypothetical protein